MGHGHGGVEEERAVASLPCPGHLPTHSAVWDKLVVRYR